MVKIEHPDEVEGVLNSIFSQLPLAPANFVKNNTAPGPFQD